MRGGGEDRKDEYDFPLKYFNRKLLQTNDLMKIKIKNTDISKIVRYIQP
jgi:hypothetical protein